LDVGHRCDLLELRCAKQHLVQVEVFDVRLDPPDVANAAADTLGSGLLGKRQAEVAQLVAQGLSNKQIGARLLKSEYIVDSHVRSILNKLGVNSRTQLAGWVRTTISIDHDW
jgi:DNA-binding NarL/FixJ family response regulator